MKHRTRTRTRIQATAALALAALMSACTSAPSQTPPPMSAADPQAAPNLVSYDWNLVAAFDAQGQADGRWLLASHAPLQLHFEDQRLSVRRLCNVLGAHFGTQGNDIQLTQTMSTKRACVDQALMQLEDRVATLLPTVKRYQLRAGTTPELQLLFADGTRWQLAGQPTPQTRYGGPGERIFLEVAPQLVACGPGAVTDAQCLRVREIHYADNGLKRSVGEWQVLRDEVQGYTHEKGVRNVLRINRYPLKNPPANAPTHAYVLDMVVESERPR